LVVVRSESIELEVADDGRKERKRSLKKGGYFHQRSLSDVPLMPAGKDAIDPSRTHSESPSDFACYGLPFTLGFLLT
jgi:hypothetical protein